MNGPVGLIKLGGAILVALGTAFIVIVGDLFSLKFVSEIGVSLDGNMARMAINGGFGMLLLGIFALFLYSGRALPEEYTRAFLRTQGESSGRLIEALNLEGNGIYMPPRGRLTRDRVFIPLDRRQLEVPSLSDDLVFHTGSMGPNLGASFIPPGAGLVDEVEKGSGVPFGSEPMSGATEALERLSKGTGLFREITVRDRKEFIELEIVHGVLQSTCTGVWEGHPDLHRKLGCPACSCVLCATARMAKRPLEIVTATRDRSKVSYKLRKG